MRNLAKFQISGLKHWKKQTACIVWKYVGNIVEKGSIVLSNPIIWKICFLLYGNSLEI